QRGRDAAEVEALAAGENCRQDFLRVGRGEDEFDVGRWFFERFQQRVERGGAEHVDFVDDVDLELGAGGRVPAGLAEFADLFDAVVGRAVDFEDVEGVAGGDFFTVVAFV